MGRSFVYPRTIHFPDTDAAGVVFFARYLSMAHEAYEEALGAAGVELQTFFAANAVVVPIARSEAVYLRPLECGDRIEIALTPTRLSENSFAVDYTLWKQVGSARKRAATLRTEHVCIDAKVRERRPLPPAIAAWVDAAPDA